jgi:hypothetical protein
MVVDVVLLVALGALAVGHFQGTPGGDPSSPSSTAATDDAMDFRMPSGRVACHMDASGVVCGMNDVKAWQRVDRCPADHVVVLDEAGARPVCAGTVDLSLPDRSGRDDFGGADFPTGAPALDYGDSVSAAGYECESRRAGVLCTNPDGQWFNLRLQDGLTTGGPDDDPPS